MADSKLYPLPKFHFSVTWDGKRTGFTEVTGLDMQIDKIEYREGSQKEMSKLQMPGLHKYSNLTLKRGSMAGDKEFYDWINTASGGPVQRRSVTIELLNEKGEAVMAWTANNAFPVKVQASDLKADGNEVAIETMELAHEGLTLNNL